MIYSLKTNDQINPYGIIDDISYSFIATKGNRFEFVLSNDIEFHNLLIKKEVLLDNVNHFKADYKYEKGHHYFWKIVGEEEESEVVTFFVADDLDASFITPKEDITHPVFFKEFDSNNIKEARLVVTGLGLYQCYLNGNKIDHGYLNPGFNDYDDYLRYQEIDITSLVKEYNKLEVIVGDGIYKGRMGFDNHPGEIWGSKYLLCAKVILIKNDGTREEILTDTSWKVHPSTYLFSTIYDGEIRDDNIDCSKESEVETIDVKYNLTALFSPIITSHEILKPELIISKSGEQILDFKQNMVGFVRFVNKTPKGNKIHLQYGEILQNDCFYRDNLRTAKCELLYTSDGVNKVIESLFTFYGFRYVKVEGIDQIDVNDFEGVVIHTDLENTLTCSTSDQKINQLIHNALWGQKGNFLDVPTDCPQRDERLGWTGDTQVFATTACMNMSSKLFYKKFFKDLRAEQTRYYDGDIPCFAPSLKKSASVGGAIWGDVAIISPMKVYEEYGDIDLLEESYPMMKEYVEVLYRNDIDSCHGSHLISNRFTFGDWLAMDGVTSQSRKGGTDDTYLSSVYYYNSVQLMAKAAKILNKEDDYKHYQKLADETKLALREEYFSKNGRLCFDTQTSYILALYYDLAPNKDKVIESFKQRLSKDCFTMKSGFAGTPLALPTLFDAGMGEDAYRMLFSEKCPGWLFAVNMGATTIWERWNSVLEDGTISGTDMNSLNHYAYGSVCEAIYTRIAGLRNKGNAYKEVVIKPNLNYRLKAIDLSYESIRGKYSIKYVINKDNTLDLEVTIPHGCKATIVLPDKSNDNVIDVIEGTYKYHYLLEKDYNHPFNMFTSFLDILANKDALQAVYKTHPIFAGIAQGDVEMALCSPFVLSQMGFLPVTVEQAMDIDKALKEVEA